ncbi:hypothetical protein JH06_4254 [Blastocystis sp. subtype 4]|uniref:hypothetical protein n=1 Tax=Blastocystis sp. subtype 4 TaxID=944170 RepID=UPI000712128C|nr:hypothetical protein JH06_4254 [Blastocystis sp. subtype 4]KNB42530.1 hypothetical protein JH06_4254 [Blastocystis sp. subtype 4]|eukprot:XP_014525973.1 hypothetical protein JH06_4254 [Blastocystis sp. subtype 4]
MDQPIIPEEEIVTTCLEINNQFISAIAENQNLARFPDAIQYLKLLAKNLKYLGDHCDTNVEVKNSGVVSVVLLMSPDVAKFCQEWIKTQDDVVVRPLSPESKEAIDSGTLVKESIPVFYLDADKKVHNKEHKSELFSIIDFTVRTSVMVSKHSSKKREKKHHKEKKHDKKKEKKVTKE